MFEKELLGGSHVSLIFLVLDPLFGLFVFIGRLSVLFWYCYRIVIVLDPLFSFVFASCEPEREATWPEPRSKKHKVLFIDDVHQNHPLEEVKEARSLRQNLARERESESPAHIFMRRPLFVSDKR